MDKEKWDEMVNKLARVVSSCQTLEHLDSALKYLELFKKKSNFICYP